MKNLLFTVLFVWTLGTQAQNNKKPNVIIIFNDDLGYQDLGCYGSPNIKTPRVDQLAKEGMRFTDFYSASPVCSASRAALLTGCYPHRVGVAGVIHAGATQGLSPKHMTLAEVMKSVGYATAAVGKWHLGDQPQHLPTNQGFDSFFGIPFSNDMYPSKNIPYAANCLFNEGFDLEKINALFTNMKPNEKQPESAKHKVPLMRNIETIEFPVDQTTITKRYADEGIQFIKQSVIDKKPFFLYLANSMPHIPLYVSPQFKGKSKRGLYGDVVEEIDYHTGRILDLLKELKIDTNTIVIFSSDNGPWLTKGEDGGSALPLFEGKFTSFEGGMRVPFIIKWPNVIKGGTVSKDLAATIDVLPTLAQITNAKLPEISLDGQSILDLCKNTDHKTPPHEYFFMVYKGQAVRNGDWKYHKKRTFTVNKNSTIDETPALYNLKEDVGETKNLINEYPEIAHRLSQALEDHLTRLNIKK